MSYTLKTQQIAVKDPDTGTYSGVDVLTEQTKSGLLAEIQAEGAAQRTSVTNTGSAQVSAVQAKGAETLASIPSDYTALSNEVDDLKNTLIHTNELFKCQYKEIDGCGINSAGEIGLASGKKIYCFGLEPNQLIDEIRSNASVCSFAYYIAEPVDGSVSYNGGRTVATSIPVRNQTVPAGCYWLACSVDNTYTVTIEPGSIYIKKIAQLETRTTEIETNIGQVSIGQMRNSVTRIETTLGCKYKEISGNTIDSSGIIGTAAGKRICCFEVLPGENIKSISSSASVVSYAFYVNEPVVGSVSYNGARSTATVLPKLNTVVPENCYWLACSVDTAYNVAIDPVSNYIETFKNNDATITRFNANNVLPFINKEETTTNNVKYSITNGVIAFASGTASAFTAINLGEKLTSLPNDINYGDRVYVYFSDESIDGFTFQLLNSANNDVIYATKTNGWFVMPSGWSEIRIRIAITSGTNVAGKSFTPYVGKNAPLNILSKKLYPDNPGAMLTIIDDDGHKKFYTDLLPVIISKKVPISSAIYNTSIGVAENTMTWEQVEEAYLNGAEILSHSYDHADSEVIVLRDENEIQRYDQMAKNDLIRRGFSGGKILVYTGATANIAKVVNAAKNVYIAGINSAGNSMSYIDTIDPYNIKRYPVGQFTEAQLKSLIDDCISGVGWMIWMIHTSSPDWSSSDVEAISGAIDYALSEGLPIVTVEAGLRKMGIV